MTTQTLLPARYRSLVASPVVRVAAGVAAFMAASISSSGEDGVVLCPFRRCTGGYCPGCGLTRSSGRLVRGDLAGSWHQHPFLVIGVVQATAVIGLWGSGSRWWPAIRERMPALLLANTALLVAIWVARLAGGGIPVPFG